MYTDNNSKTTFVKNVSKLNYDIITYDVYRNKSVIDNINNIKSPIQILLQCLIKQKRK